MVLKIPFPVLSGVGPFEEEFVSEDRQDASVAVLTFLPPVDCGPCRGFAGFLLCVLPLMLEVLCGPPQAGNWLGISVQCEGLDIRTPGEPSLADSVLFLQRSQTDSEPLAPLMAFS